MTYVFALAERVTVTHAGFTPHQHQHFAASAPPPGRVVAYRPATEWRPARVRVQLEAWPRAVWVNALHVNPA